MSISALKLVATKILFLLSSFFFLKKKYPAATPATTIGSPRPNPKPNPSLKSLSSLSLELPVGYFTQRVIITHNK